MLACLTLALLAAAGVHAQAPDPEFARDVAAGCTACHGTTGMSLGTVPSLAGQPRADLVAKLKEFRSGARPATVMQQLAKGYSDDEIDQVAGWYAAQPAK
jgi:cytochrome c553